MRKLRGYVPLRRSILDNDSLAGSDLFILIAVCIACNHADSTIRWDGRAATVKRGEFVTSNEELARLTRYDERTVRRSIRRLVDAGFVTCVKARSKRHGTWLKLADVNRFIYNKLDAGAPVGCPDESPDVSPDGCPDERPTYGECRERSENSENDDNGGGGEDPTTTTANPNPKPEPAKAGDAKGVATDANLTVADERIRRGILRHDPAADFHAQSFSTENLFSVVGLCQRHGVSTDGLEDLAGMFAHRRMVSKSGRPDRWNLEWLIEKFPTLLAARSSVAPPPATVKTTPSPADEDCIWKILEGKIHVAAKDVEMVLLTSSMQYGIFIVGNVLATKVGTVQARDLIDRMVRRIMTDDEGWPGYFRKVYANTEKFEAAVGGYPSGAFLSDWRVALAATWTAAGCEPSRAPVVPSEKVIQFARAFMRHVGAS